MELQLTYPDRDEASPGNPAGRHPLRSARHEKNSNRKLDAVRKREPHVRHVGFIYDGSLPELAHTARLLCAQQMAHAGMPADKFSSRGLLKPLGSAAVRLQFHFLVLLHNFLVPASSYASSGTGTLACAQFIPGSTRKIAVKHAS
jgi:hypothetical protein